MNLLKWLNKCLAKKQKYFVSPIDRFLMQFDQVHPEKSGSQTQEIKNYQKIYYLRDHKQSPPFQTTSLWSKFE
jgi:hypothetical protein